MSNITEWIKTELYPSVFPYIDRAFPEHQFQQRRGNWQSKTYLSGAPHSRTDKTIVTRKAPGTILEQGGPVMSLVDYVIQRDSVEFIQAVRTLAEVAGVELPNTDLDPQAYQKYRDQVTILEDCNSYFIFCLSNAKGAAEVQAYLHERGYSEADISAMELGYIPSQDQLYKYLSTKGYSSDQITQTVKLNKAIGQTHKLSIPYRTGGSIKGFKFRTIADHQPKYLNSTGLERNAGFFNLAGLKGDKDVVIVEGELDSLSATARGVDNVVATGGNSVSAEQVQDAIRRGVKSFTICLDNEPGKQAETESKVTSVIRVITDHKVNRIYIANLPESEVGKTDPDSYIKQAGVEAFKQVIAEAVPYYEYLLARTISKYAEIEQERGLLQPRDIDSLLEEVVQTAAALPDPIDRDRYKYLFTSLDEIGQLGITPESLDITVDRLTSTKEKEAQDKALESLLFNATQLQVKGEAGKALDLLESQVREVKLSGKGTEYSKLLKTPTEEEIRQQEANMPDSLNTGYRINGEELLLPGGAISVYAAPTNHGKTAMLINTTLQVADRYPDKRFIFFTYEESDNSIIQYFLNTYMDLELNSLSGSNRRLLREYFKTGSTKFMKGEALDYFNRKKDDFFKTYIEPGRILVKYVDYNSSEIITAIDYLQKHTDNLAGVFIDYFQLLRLPTDSYKNYNSRQEELKQICIALKDAAVNTGLPVILAAQFNREATNLMRLHPTNIGEAGDIERIVNTLIGIWNMHKKPVLKGITKPEEDEINRRTQGVEKGMYLEILKARDLPTGSYEVLDFNGNTGKISNRKEQQTNTNDPF